VPCLFVSGTHDAFASPAELEAETAAIAGAVTHVWVDGDHSLRRRDAEVASRVAEWMRTLMGVRTPA
jgi:predicted alpha/beta-hydrolase family hydrolase